mgnify:CR=1 FL=1
MDDTILVEPMVGVRPFLSGQWSEETLRKMFGPAAVNAAKLEEEKIFADGEWQAAQVYRRDLLKCGNIIAGPAIVTQLDSTALILPGHHGEIDAIGNILIRPVEPN